LACINDIVLKEVFIVPDFKSVNGPRNFVPLTSGPLRESSRSVNYDEIEQLLVSEVANVKFYFAI